MLKKFITKRLVEKKLGDSWLSKRYIYTVFITMSPMVMTEEKIASKTL